VKDLQYRVKELPAYGGGQGVQSKKVNSREKFRERLDGVVIKKAANLSTSQ